MRSFPLAVAFVVALAAGADGQNHGRYRIVHEGRSIEVFGYIDQYGRVVWQSDDPRNAQPPATPPATRPAPPVAPGTKLDPKPEAQPKPNDLDWRTNGVPPGSRTAPNETYTAESTEAARFVFEANEKSAGDKMHVTIIGNVDECARVVDDIKNDQSFSAIRNTLLVQDYRPGEWPVDPALGFVPGKPAIIVQAGKGQDDKAGGRVIYRSLDYSMGATGLAEAIRKARPDYRPDKDPGPANPGIGPDNPALASSELIVSVVILALASLGLAFLLPAKAK